MNPVFVFANLLTLIYIIIRLCLLKFTVTNDFKQTLKSIVTESCLVFVSVLACEFLHKKMGWKSITSASSVKAPSVFTDNAGF